MHNSGRRDFSGGGGGSALGVGGLTNLDNSGRTDLRGGGGGSAWGVGGSDGMISLLRASGGAFFLSFFLFFFL